MQDNLHRFLPAPIEYRGKYIDFSSGPIIMAVLNITPDSFFDGGRYTVFDIAIEKAFKMIEQGAEIIDIGGASSRPGSGLVPSDIQKERILPIISAVRKQWNGWISVDTYTAEVAEAAIDAGADIINDISSGRIDPEMKNIAAEFGGPCILMHMRGTPEIMQDNPVYHSLLPEIIRYFEECIIEWEGCGVSRDKILLDPGIGFGKKVEHNLLILKCLDKFHALGRPIVLGTSRKSFIGTLLDKEVEERLSGTLATIAIGAWHGANVIRVHDVKETRDVITMIHAIKSVQEYSVTGKQ